MKTFFTIVLSAIISFTSFAHEPVSYSKVIQSEGKTADELYNSVKMWVATNFHYAEKVIQMDDAAQKMIQLKTNFDYDKWWGGSGAYTGWVHYNIMVRCREGRLKVDVINISHEAKPNQYKIDYSFGIIYDTEQQFTKGADKNIRNRACAHIKELMTSKSSSTFASIEEAITKATVPIDEEEW